MNTSRSTPLRRAATLALLAAAVSSCSSDSSTGPGDGELAGLSEVLSEATPSALEGVSAGMVSSSLVPGAPALGAPMSAPAVVPSRCGYDAPSQSFVCPQVTHNGMTIDRSFILFDAAGNRQSQFSRTTTAAVRTKTRATGTMTSPAGSRTIEHVDDRTVSGLLSTRRVLNGTSSMKSMGSFTGPASPTPVQLNTAGITTIENLVLPSREHRWPGPGTVTTVTTSSFGTLPPMTSTSRATFDGTRCVTITISSERSTHTRVMDLSNPRATGCTP